MWNLVSKLKSAYALRVLEKQILYKIFRPSTEVVWLDQRKLHSKKLHNLYFSQNNVAYHTDRLIKSKSNSRNVDYHSPQNILFLLVVFKLIQIKKLERKGIIFLLDYIVRPGLSNERQNIDWGHFKTQCRETHYIVRPGLSIERQNIDWGHFRTQCGETHCCLSNCEVMTFTNYSFKISFRSTSTLRRGFSAVLMEIIRCAVTIQ